MYGVTPWHLLVFFILWTMSAASQASNACKANIVVTGYWPPTNEMIRHFSTNPQRNPTGWLGENWRGSGYDVHAFFPEFPPDGDPTNDNIGDAGSVGADGSDFQVDYQDTSADFWRIVDQYQPRILITTSRGGDIGWELEAIEGGHGDAEDWIGDGWGETTHPLPETLASRSADMLHRHARNTIRSTLPLEAIQQAVAELKVIDVAIDDATSGNYLSGFMGLHGLYYHQTHLNNVAAGHIHVGREVEAAVARQVFETTLATIINQHPMRCAGQGELGQGE